MDLMRKQKSYPDNFLLKNIQHILPSEILEKCLLILWKKIKVIKNKQWFLKFHVLIASLQIRYSYS